MDSLYDRTSAGDLIRLLRPRHYLKNGFVFVGAIFGHHWDWSSLMEVSIAFVAFCSAASAVYIFNDLVDVDSDRQHPLKRQRPIAAGAVPVSTARRLCTVLALGACALGASVSTLGFGLIGAYLALNTIYSLRLKHVVILDVFLVSAGFMLRILIGTLGVGIQPSEWLLLTGLMLTLFIAFAKRRAELLLVERSSSAPRAATRRVLDDYDRVILDLFMGVTAACTILSYGLYSVSPETLAKHGSRGLFYTLPFVVYGIFRYMFLVHQGHGGNDPARDVLTDRQLLFTLAGWLAVTVWVLA